MGHCSSLGHSSAAMPTRLGAPCGVLPWRHGSRAEPYHRPPPGARYDGHHHQGLGPAGGQSATVGHRPERFVLKRTEITPPE